MSPVPERPYVSIKQLYLLWSHLPGVGTISFTGMHSVCPFTCGDGSELPKISISNENMRLSNALPTFYLVVISDTQTMTRPDLIRRYFHRTSTVLYRRFSSTNLRLGTERLRDMTSFQSCWKKPPQGSVCFVHTLSSIRPTAIPGALLSLIQSVPALYLPKLQSCLLDHNDTRSSYLSSIYL